MQLAVGAVGGRSRRGGRRVWSLVVPSVPVGLLVDFGIYLRVTWLYTSTTIRQLPVNAWLAAWRSG